MVSMLEADAEVEAAVAGRDKRAAGSADTGRVLGKAAMGGDGNGCSDAVLLPLAFLLCAVWSCGGCACVMLVVAVAAACVLCGCCCSTLPIEVVTRALLCSAANRSLSAEVSVSDGCLR